ncbi:hypothetical protein DEU56DRAFT_749337, partial [Suillus clintonianus]|uniref:uncharacterized protein n=1 Tax=Suillus clintonianus TaxID=1904413 RepID=UPI001B879526
MNDIYSKIQLNDLCTSLAMILDLQSAKLDDPGIGLGEDALQHLRNPPQYTLSLHDPITRAAIKTYINLTHSDHDYESQGETIMELMGKDFPSLYLIEKLVAELSRVESLMHNMCIDSCYTFIGPFANCDNCPGCGKPRYKDGPRKEPQCQFPTIPIGPQIQALICDPKSAEEMWYHDLYTQNIFTEL